MRLPYSIMIGKAVQSAARLRGGGSALPGLVMEKIDSGFVARALSDLPRGVVIISGTNGKTTTTKMVVELLEGQGLRVFTNRTGSNFVRGVAAALLGEVDRNGVLQADVAVLELDEAHAVQFVRHIAPRYSLLLNVMRDQLDRFGEIDTTADMLHTIAAHTTDGVVINRDDPRLGSNAFIEDLNAPLRSYGVSPELLKQFPADDDLRAKPHDSAHTSTLYAEDTSLESIDGRQAVIAFDATVHTVSLKLSGVYNILNAVGAIALTRLIMGDALDKAAMLHSLENVTPAFGRGETITVNNTPVELVLVKNPSGFRLGLSSFSPDGYITAIAINDNYADGRDMSWLWDVEFESLAEHGVEIVSGVRAYDMALRLQYDDVPVHHVVTTLTTALQQLLDTQPDKPKRIFCTYTCMLAIRRELRKYATVETIR